MTDTATSITPATDRKTKIEIELTHIEREIRNKRHDIDCLREEIADLEIEREELLEQLEQLEETAV